MIPFYDSTDPAALIPPADFTHVAGYGTGRYTWPDATFERYEKYIKVAVFPGQPQQAKIARCLDVERFDATPDDFAPFARVRHSIGHADALAYCSLSLVGEVMASMEKDPATPWSLWLAWWWQRPMPPTASQVLAELRDGFGVTLPPHRLWGCQWKPGGPFDSSVLYQRDNFTPGKK